MPKAFKKCIYQRTKKLSSKLGVSGEAKDADWDIHLWAIEFLLWSAPILWHTGIQIVLCTFMNFPRVLLTFPNSIHGPSDSLFPFFSAPRDVRASFLHCWLYFHFRHGRVSVLAVDILPLFSWSRSHHSLSPIVPFHITFFGHPPQPHQLARLMETVNLACFLSIPTTRNHFQQSLLFTMEKKSRKESCSVWSQAHSGRGWLIMQLPAPGKEGKECRAQLKYRNAHTFKHTVVCPVIEMHLSTSPSFILFLHVGMCLWGSPFFSFDIHLS